MISEQDSVGISLPGLEIIEIRDLETLESQVSELARFVNDFDVAASVYHLPAYITSRIRTQQTILDWRLIVVKQGGEFVCMIPFWIEEIRMPIKFGVFTLFRVKTRLLKFFGDHIALARSFSIEKASRLVELTLNYVGAVYDMALIESLFVDDPLFSGFSFKVHAGKGELVLTPSSRVPELVHVVKFPGNWDAYLGAMSKKRRYNLKRNVKQLYEACGGEVELRRFCLADEVGEFLDILERVHNSTWQAKTFGKRTRNTHTAMSNAMALADTGCLCAYVLFVHRMPVAFVRGYLHKGLYYFEEIGYDRDWGEHSVGNVLNYLVLEDLMNSPRKVNMLNFGYGDNVYKRVFGNVSYRAVNAYLYRRRSRAAIIVFASRASSNFYFWLRSMLVGLKLDHVFRRILKKRT